MTYLNFQHLAVLDYDRRLRIRNELLEMGATVSNISEPDPYDLGSQFETFSTRNDRCRVRHPSTDSDDSTLIGNRNSRPIGSQSSESTICPGPSTISTSKTHIEPSAFSEDGLDSDDQNGMNYQMLLNYQCKEIENEFEPQFQKGNHIISLELISTYLQYPTMCFM